MEKNFSPTFYFRAQKKFGGKYIVRKKNKILAAAKTLSELLKLMKKKKIEHKDNVSIGFVPSSRLSYVFKNWRFTIKNSVCLS